MVELVRSGRTPEELSHKLTPTAPACRYRSSRPSRDRRQPPKPLRWLRLVVQKPVHDRFANAEPGQDPWILQLHESAEVLGIGKTLAERHEGPTIGFGRRRHRVDHHHAGMLGGCA